MRSNFLTGSVTTLLNKGEIFEGALNFDPVYVQAAPVLEQLLCEALGGGKCATCKLQLAQISASSTCFRTKFAILVAADFLINSFQAIIAHQHNYPQALHQDLNGSSPFQHPEAPLMLTAMFLLDDVGQENGGTLVIPGSHRIVAHTSQSEGIAALPPPINISARAGTILLFDHRLLHGTGVNRSPHPRHVLIAGFHRTWMRTQEAWLLSAAPEVIARASPRLLQRLGFVGHTIGTVRTWHATHTVLAESQTVAGGRSRAMD